MVKFFSLKKHCCNSVLLSLSKSRLKYFVTITVVTKVSCIFVTSGFLNFSFFYYSSLGAASSPPASPASPLAYSPSPPPASAAAPPSSAGAASAGPAAGAGC